jgi:hypothetical protein
MGLVKNQHYVPRSYLKYFADKNNKIFVFDKDKDSVFQTNITNVATERFFYDLPADIIPDAKGIIEDKQIIEKFFSQLEDEFLKFLNNIRTRFTMSPDPFNTEAVSWKEKAHLSYMLALQYMRTKDFRRTLLDAKELMMQALVDGIGELEIEGYEPGMVKVERIRDFDSVEHAHFMFDPDTLNNFAEVFYNHIWVIGVNRTSIPLFTSDSPIVKYPHKKSDGLISYSGIASPGIEIDFPISNKLVLMMVERNYFKEISPFLENRFIPLDDIENIKFLNWLQVKGAYRQVYCKTNEFEIIKDMKKHQPDILKRKSKITVQYGRKKYQR